MIQQGSVTVRRVVHLLDELREERHEIGVDPGVLLDVVGVVLVMRHGMMPLGHADLGVRPAARLPCNLRAGDTCDIRLVREHQQLHQKTRVLVVLIWYASGLLERGERCAGVVELGTLDSALDFSNRIKVLRHRSPIANAQPPFEAAHALGH